MTADMPHVQIMSRRECGLCESARSVVERAARQGLCSWESVDVDKDKTLLIRYGMDVPVVLVNGTEYFRHGVDTDALNTILGSCEC